jgi:hypothetical protein
METSVGKSRAIPRRCAKSLRANFASRSSSGKAIILRDESILRLKDLYKLFADEEIITQNPSVLMTIQFDYLVAIRFFSKLALAMGHPHWGEMFSRSARAEALRRHMTVANWQDVTLRGAIWPGTDSVKGVLQLIEKEDHHEKRRSIRKPGTHWRPVISHAT